MNTVKATHRSELRAGSNDYQFYYIPPKVNYRTVKKINNNNNSLMKSGFEGVYCASKYDLILLKFIEKTTKPNTYFRGNFKKVLFVRVLFSNNEIPK